jgi:hypothetical protein
LQSFKSKSKIVVDIATEVQKTLNTLVQQGSITGDLATFIQSKLPQGVKLVNDINDKVQAITAWPPANAADIINTIQIALDFITQTMQDGLLKFGDFNKQVGGWLVAIQVALGVLKVTLQTQTASNGNLREIDRQIEKMVTIRDALRTQVA